ncbi:MAG: glycosyltransferase [Bdellovibrionales bacterium]|nr:glycosyltransferase [Bdellovibrionales bacterium]
MEKPKILFITHAYHNRGGVEEHLKVILNEFASKAECFTAFPMNSEIHLLRGTSPDPIEVFPGTSLDLIAPLTDPLVEESYSKIFEFVQPDVIHLMHFAYWPISIVKCVATSPVKRIVSFHDFYLLTPQFTMMGRSDVENFCSREYCEATLGKDLSGYMENRRSLLSECLPQFQHRLVPSHFLERTLQRVHRVSFDVLPYGIPSFPASPSRKKNSKKKKIIFGYLGALLPQKGCQSLLTAFQGIQEQFPHAELHLYGSAKSTPENLKQIFFHGGYSQEDLPTIMNSIDIGIIPSVFPETYSIVLSELWQAQKPVAVSNIGALAERVLDGVNGRKFTPGNPAAIAEVLTWFMTSEEWRDFETPTPFTAQEMAQQLWGWYSTDL